MKNSWDQAMEYADFQTWFETFSETADYFVATSQMNSDELWAFKLCLAYSWLDGFATHGFFTEGIK